MLLVTLSLSGMLAFAQNRTVTGTVVDDNGEGTEFQIMTEKELQPYLLKNQIRYIKHDINRNGSAARNTGVKAAKGDIIGLLDDDDEFLPNKIEEQVKCLISENKKDNSVRGCFCNGYIVGPKRNRLIINKPCENMAEQLLLGKVRFNSSTIVMFKDTYMSINGFDERYIRHQDWEFILRFLQKYKFVLACPNTYLNIKYGTPNILTKNPLKAIQYKEFFLDNFKEYIGSLNKTDEIYHHQYALLSFSLIRNRCYKEAYDYLKKCKNYKVLTIQEYFKIINCFILGLTK